MISAKNRKIQKVVPIHMRKQLVTNKELENILLFPAKICEELWEFLVKNKD